MWRIFLVAESPWPIRGTALEPGSRDRTSRGRGGRAASPNLRGFGVPSRCRQSWSAWSGRLPNVDVTVPVRQPAGLVYGVEERPTTTVSVVSALQLVGVVAIFIVYPLIVARPSHSAGRECGS